MQRIDEARLDHDLAYRFEYVSGFMGFGAEDIAVITGARELLAPLVPALVDAVYEKLFGYDATMRPFLLRQNGYTGAVPASFENVTHEHELIQYRKQHLANYLARLVTGPYDAKLVEYLDTVGKMHTPAAGNPSLNVPLVHMNALLGFVADAVNATIFGFNLPAETTPKAIRAFGKLLWIQNDLINRHYARPMAAAQRGAAAARSLAANGAGA